MTALTWLAWTGIAFYAGLDPVSYWFGVSTVIAILVGWRLGDYLCRWWARHRP